MPVLDSKQRARLTVEERQRLAKLIGATVHGSATPDEKKELQALMEKAGPRDPELEYY